MQTRHLLCSLFLLPVSLFAANIDLSGTYKASGFDPKGGDYRGTVEIKASGFSDKGQTIYDVRSYYCNAGLGGPYVMEGTALQTGDYVALVYKGTEDDTVGTQQFNVTEAGCILQGTFVGHREGTVGTETLTKQDQFCNCRLP